MTAFNVGFAPDLDPTLEGVITACDNLIPTLKGYAGAMQGVDVGMNAVASHALAAALITKIDASNRLFAGVSNKLYEKSGLTWADVSRATAYNASTTYPWRFAQFGDTTIAANKVDVLQASSTGAFSDLTAPKAAVICVASDFVMIANTFDATYGDSFDRWWCSALLNHTDWVPAISTQCTTGRLVKTAGPITGIKSFGDDVVAYKDKSLYLGRYVGSPGVWDFALISDNVGCSSQEAIANIESAHIFIGDDDIYIFNRAPPTSIGAPLREWFFEDLDKAHISKIIHAHDHVNSLVYFYYPRNGNAGVLNGGIVYNYKTNKWGVAHQTIECVLDYVLGGYTWDTLPVTTWDSWPATEYDSSYWKTSTKYSAYIGTDHKVYAMLGNSTTASLSTGHYGDDNKYTLLSRITLRYLATPLTATATNYYQTVHGATWTTDKVTTETNGRFDLLRSAPWHRATFNFTGNFELTGVTADISQGGVF